MDIDIPISQLSGNNEIWGLTIPLYNNLYDLLS